MSEQYEHLDVSLRILKCASTDPQIHLKSIPCQHTRHTWLRERRKLLFLYCECHQIGSYAHVHGLVPHKGWIVSVFWIQFRAIALQLECADSLLNPKQWISYGSFEATAYFCHRSGNVAFLDFLGCICSTSVIKFNLKRGLGSEAAICVPVKSTPPPKIQEASYEASWSFLFIYWLKYVNNRKRWGIVLHEGNLFEYSQCWFSSVWWC